MLTSELFEIDNEVIKRKFFIKNKNIMIWPLIRWKVQSYIVRKEQNWQTPQAGHSKLSFKNLRYLYYTFIYNPIRLKKKFDILFFVNARGRINNKNFNIDSDHYSSLYPDKTLDIESPFQGKYYPPTKKGNYATGDFGNLIAFLFYQVKRLISNKNEDIEEFISFLKTLNYFDNKFIKEIRNKLYYYYLGYDIYQAYVKKVIKKLKPKVIFVRTATYGGLTSLLIKIAKQNQVSVAEFQHGSISNNHIAYNCGSSIFKNKSIQDYLPEYILTYGDFWNDKIRMPIKKQTIGNPHFYYKLKTYDNVQQIKNSVLLISQGALTDEFIKIVKYLSRELKDYKFFFKLHPEEVPFESRYSELYDFENVEVVKFGDIYEYFASCEIIIACFSTSIYEALGFKKSIFLLDNDLSKDIPNNIGTRFKKVEELKNLILNRKNQELGNNLEYFFNSNWEMKYKQFLSKEIGLD